MDVLITYDSFEVVRKCRTASNSYINHVKSMYSLHMVTRIIKNILKNERVCRDIYQNQKSTGTRWLWQQNEIPLPHNNRTQYIVFQSGQLLLDPP